MKPPATCAELVRRLKAIAVPMHGQSHHDVRLAAAVLEAIDGTLAAMWNSTKESEAKDD